MLAMETLKTSFIVLFIVQVFLQCNSEPETRKSLNEIIDATLDAKFDEIFTGEPKMASALAMLKYSIENTNIEPKYLTGVFYEAVGATSDEELGKHVFPLEKAVDMMNKVIKHFQEAPADAGMPAASQESQPQREDL